MRTTTLSSLLVCYLGIGHVWADNTQHGPPDDIWMPNPSSQHLQASSNDGSEGPATRSNEWLASPGNIPTPPKTPWFKYIKKKGRVTVDVNNENNIPPPEPVVSEAPNNGTDVVELTPNNANNNNLSRSLSRQIHLL
ncbi:expressed unknown protein [Seminavis robusta]|uniref:Uncharacterized protein n=1 Tax=Seminavis robusta TaxID=568900 RepID=A0A9N8HEI5_9STRA|nr:expressed unknown protein [Seminavis robusta]|eukprot:Sro408_g136900.1 n/a (137) ;mRNA; r:24271-24681